MKNKNTSSTIDFIRLPLMILVIYIHLALNICTLPSLQQSEFSEDEIISLVYLFILNISSIAVPSFFFISGYLFFKNKYKLSLEDYKDKLKSRIRTLLIPYIAWNLLAVCMQIVRFSYNGKDFEEIVAGYILPGASLFWDVNKWNYYTNDFGITSYMSGPILMPLWYLRDLIVVCILSPLINLLLRKIRVLYLLLLLIAFLLGLWFNISGLGINSLMFFSLGACTSMYKVDLLKYRKYGMWMTIPFCVMCFFSLCLGGSFTRNGMKIMPFFVLITIPVFFSISSKLVEKYDIKTNKYLVNSIFFIYCCHGTNIFVRYTPISLVQKLFRNVFPCDVALIEMIINIISPFFIFLLCFCMYFVFVRYIPRLTSCFTGYR